MWVTNKVPVDSFGSHPHGLTWPKQTLLFYRYQTGSEQSYFAVGQPIKWAKLFPKKNPRVNWKIWYEHNEYSQIKVRLEIYLYFRWRIETHLIHSFKKFWFPIIVKKKTINYILRYWWKCRFTYNFNASKVLTEYRGEFGSVRCTSISCFDSTRPRRMIFCKRLASAALKLKIKFKLFSARGEINASFNGYILCSISGIRCWLVSRIAFAIAAINRLCRLFWIFQFQIVHLKTVKLRINLRRLHTQLDPALKS